MQKMVICRGLDKLSIAHYVFHGLAYYFAWFSAVLTAQMYPIWLGPLIIFFISCLQILWQQKVMEKTKGLYTMIILFVLGGGLADTLLIQTHLLSFHNVWFEGITSPFMVALWFNFGILFYALMMYLKDKYIWLIGLSLVGFPLTYLGGAKLGAATIHQGQWSLIMTGLVYAFVFPGILFIYNQMVRKHA